MSDAAIELAEAIAKFVRRDINCGSANGPKDGGRQTARDQLVAVLDAHILLDASVESGAEWKWPPRAVVPELPEADNDEAWTALMRKVYPDGRRSALFLRQLDAAFATIGILRADLARSNMVNRSHEQRERVDAKVMQKLKDENDRLRAELARIRAYQAERPEEIRDDHRACGVVDAENKRLRIVAEEMLKAITFVGEPHVEGTRIFFPVEISADTVYRWRQVIGRG